MASSYLLAQAACSTFLGKISDIWGRKPILLLVNFTFLVGSLICALSINLSMMLVGRAAQGIGGGGIMVLANICITDLFSVRERPLPYGVISSVWGIAGGLGPIIGGAITTRSTWRWCFYLNCTWDILVHFALGLRANYNPVPVGGLSFAGLLFFLKIENPRTPFIAGIRSVDWTGSLFIIGGTLMFLFGLEFGGGDYPWKSATVICLILFGIISWAMAMIIEWKVAKYPVIPVRLFHNRHNIVVFLICISHGIVFMGFFYFLPLYFQSVLLVTPLMSGVYVLPSTVMLSIVSVGNGIFMRKFGRYRESIVFGMIFLVLGIGLFIDLKSYPSWPRIIIYQILAGIGAGPNFQSPLLALQANTLPNDMAVATATFAFMRQLATSVSVVLGSVIYQNVLIDQIHSVVERVIGSVKADQLVASFAGSDKSLILSLPDRFQRRVVLNAFTLALSRMWIFYTAVSALGVLLCWFVRPIEMSKRHVHVRVGLHRDQENEGEREGDQEKGLDLGHGQDHTHTHDVEGVDDSKETV